MISASRPRRTGHPPISYRDDSTDEETNNTPPIRSSHRLRQASRPQSSSDEGYENVTELHTFTPHRRRTPASVIDAPRTIRPSRRVRNVTNYNEDSDGEYAKDEAKVNRKTRPVPSTATHPRKRPQRTQTTLKNGPFNSFKRRKTNHDHSSKVLETHTTLASELPAGRIPPWQTLPYQILLRIFQYASYPFYRDASHDTGSIAWLIQMSTLSKSFHDAAVATLLYSPPIFPSDRAHGLQRLLDAPQESLSTIYRNKVKRLDVEVRSLLIKKSGIDLVTFIKQTPLLSALHLYHNYDRVGAIGWAQPSASTGRSWTYPVELFEALDENKIQLKEWTWNGRFPDTKLVLDQMEKMHGRECLHSLTSLSLLNIAAPGKVRDDEEGALEDSLTNALRGLHKLQELKIQNCSLVNYSVLAVLPSHLRCLSITNCGNFNSVGLLSYLTTHAYELEELILNGNQALDLWFARSLETLCPRLQVFKMDLTYSDPTAFHDIDPHYEAVFPERIMPTWPRTLHTISVENLRNLDAQDAESFLTSLIVIAPELKHLRKLCIRILLQHDGWRERAELRQTWMPKLEYVFLRQAPPPTTFIPSGLQSLSHISTTTISRPSTSHSNSSSSTAATSSASAAATPNQRKSARIAKRELDDLANEPAYEMMSFYKKGNKAFKRHYKQDSNNEDEDDDDLNAEPLRQGMCTEVIFHIDGQRPADEQFKEADFLDDEVSGDEEWNGKDVEAPSRYSW